MHIRQIYLILTSLFILSNLYSQPAIENLTLSQALDLAKENNLTLQQQAQRIRQAAAELSAQKANYLPVLSVNSSYSHVSELAKLEVPFTVPGQQPIEIEAGVKDQYDVHAAIQQPVFTGFRIRNKVNSAQKELLQTKKQEHTIHNQILLSVHQVYYSIQLNQLQQKVLRASLNRARQNLESVKNFLQMGQATVFDTMKVANQVLSLRTQLNKLMHRQKVLHTRFASILNVKEISSVEPVQPNDISLNLSPLEEYQHQALRHRPELARIELQIGSQKSRKSVAQSQYFPQVFAQASYHYARPGVNFFEDEWMNYYRVGVSLKWNLWNWGQTRDRVRQAAYAITAAELEKDKFMRDIEEEIKKTYRNLLSDRDQIELTRQLVAQEKKRYGMVKTQYQQGLATPLDLTEAESDLTSAELKLQQAFINWLKNNSQMDYATGLIDSK